MCNCIKETEQKLFDHVKEKYPERTVVEEYSDGLQNKAFTFGSLPGDSGIRLFIPFQYHYTFTKKDGSTSTTKKETSNMFLTFCPFCGKKLE